MRIEKLQDLSVYYFLTNLFSGMGVTVVDAYPDELLTIPTVSVETKSLDALRFELGNRDRVAYRSWYIDVFAVNKSQRDEMAYLIKDALEECIPVYNYELGFPPTSVPQLGCLDIDTIHVDWVRVLPQLVDKLYYRASVRFTATYTNI